MRAITPALEALLKSRLQAGSGAFHARLEIDAVGWWGPASSPGAWADSIAHGCSVTAYTTNGAPDPTTPFSNVTDGTEANTYYGAGTIGGPQTYRWGWEVDLGEACLISSVTRVDPSGWYGGTSWLAHSLDGTAWTELGAVFTAEDSPHAWADPVLALSQSTWTPAAPVEARYLRAYKEEYLSGGINYYGGNTLTELLVAGARPVALETISVEPSRLSIDRSLRMAADQLEADVPNEGLPLGWSSSGPLATNMRVRAYQWYGDAANEVLSFTGLLDRVADSRDPLSVTLSCRDMMALLVDQTFGATAPQGAGEAGAVRTAANGVYLSMEASAIVADVLDRAGWPAADRAITPTSYTLAEYVVPDGQSWADAIIGADRLAGLVGYDAWADEEGVFHFAPTLTAGALTDPPAPAYTFRSGEDVTSLADELDQYDLRTRVKVRGPMTTTTLTDTWREEWRTSKIAHPVGIWWDPADSGNIRVVDSGTKRLYKVRQSDRAVLSYVYLGGAIPNPLGISGDPADASVYWVLNAPWYWGSPGTASTVKKVRKSDNAVLASYSIGTGQWSALKATSSYLYLTNLSTDLLHRRSKSTGAAVATYSHSYGGATQANPSGLMVDGTTIDVFWANSGTTARFLRCDESAPGTVVKAIATAGTALHGGEMDTSTHAHCWGDADDLGLVAKFTLLLAADQTSEVYAEVVDAALEDELGALAQSEPRLHDADAGTHPYEVRRDTVDVSAVVSLAQATETAMRRLDRLAHRRRVLDVGILGNPALQKADLVRIEDPVTGIAEDFTIDTHRSEMTAGGTYLGTLALIPVVQPGDEPADGGSAA